MKVYVVLGAWKDIGESSLRLKVFMNEEEARKYERSLLELYDYTIFQEQEIVE